MRGFDVTVTLGEIADEYQRARAGDYSRLTDYPRTLRGGSAAWGGAELEQIDRWVAEGYHDGEPLTMPDAAAPMQVPAIGFHEDEGDLIYSLAIAGEDAYRALWEPMPNPRGLSIRARLYISASVNAARVNQYVEWLLSAIDGIERLGESPDVSLYCVADATTGEEVRVTIPLRRAGEQIDTATWRALLAPGGYRCLVFLAQHVGATRVGKRLNAGLGADSIRREIRARVGWQIDCTDDVLTIAPPPQLHSFDTDELTARVEQVIR